MTISYACVSLDTQGVLNHLKCLLNRFSFHHDHLAVDRKVYRESDLLCVSTRNIVREFSTPPIHICYLSHHLCSNQQTLLSSEHEYDHLSKHPCEHDRKTIPLSCSSGGRKWKSYD